jgi:hypothetical protein
MEARSVLCEVRNETLYKNSFILIFQGLILKCSPWQVPRHIRHSWETEAKHKKVDNYAYPTPNYLPKASQAHFPSIPDTNMYKQKGT